jgi:N-acetylneuraminate synthase
VASGEVGNPQLFEAMKETGLPLIYSSGMSGWTELDEAVNRARGAKLDFAVMQCSTAYPCPPEKVGLNLLSEIRNRYRCPVGLSDHSGVVHSGIAAVALGINLYETHVTLSREMFGPDVSSSLTSLELRQLVDGIRYVEKMLANPVDKDIMASELEPLRRIFSKSVAVRVDVKKGIRIEKNMLSVKKPGIGIPATEINSVIGKKIVKDVAKGSILRWDDVEE